MSDDWQPLCDLDDVWEGEAHLFHTPDGVPVLVVNTGELRAFQGTCPHQGTPLDSADLDDGLIICSAHLWEFDAGTGAGVNPTSACLASYPIEVREGRVHVRIPSARREAAAS